MHTYMYISTNTNKMLADRRHRLCFQCSGVNKQTDIHTHIHITVNSNNNNSNGVADKLQTVLDLSIFVYAYFVLQIARVGTLGEGELPYQ